MLQASFFDHSVFWWCKSCELTTRSSHLRSASQPDGELRRHHVCQHPPSPGQARNEHGPEVRLRLRLLQGDSSVTTSFVVVEPQQ